MAIVGVSASGAAAEGQGGQLRALAVGDVGNKTFDALKTRTGLRLTRAGKGRSPNARRFDLIVLDGDVLSPRQMARHEGLRRFAKARAWVLVLDAGHRHHRRALEKETGFRVHKTGPHHSKAFLFRRELVGTTPRITMLDARPFLRGLPRNLNREGRRTARKRHARNAARALERFLSDSHAPQAAGEPGDAPAIPAELQHVQWSYSEQGSDLTPLGHYTEGYSDLFAFDPNPGTDHQTASWTMTHNFVVYLDNGDGHPQGNKQIITYDLNGQFTPKSPDEDFFHMFDRFRRGTADPIQMERAWWTGLIGNRVTPEAAADSKLLWQASQPQNPNSETSYTSGQSFSVGFTGSEEGGEVNASYEVSNEQTQTITDWGVENQGSGNSLKWTFSARNPCDARPEHYSEIQCFDISRVTTATPTQPPDLSLGQMQVDTSARWNTKGLLDGDAGRMSFDVATPVTIIDTVCTTWVFGTFACNIGGREINRRGTGPLTRTYSIDASIVNPIPIQSLTFSPNPANGTPPEGKTEGDTVTGTVTLEGAAGIDTSIVIYSDSKNAPVGVPSPGGISSRVITVEKGERTATFELTTNDTNVPDRGLTANITVFYADALTKSLRICAGSRRC